MFLLGCFGEFPHPDEDWGSERFFVFGWSVEVLISFVLLV